MIVLEFPQFDVCIFRTGDRAASHLEQQQYHNRYVAFRDRNWNVTYDDNKKTETDEYDCYPTLQFVCTDNKEHVLGGFRLRRFDDVNKATKTIVTPRNIIREAGIVTSMLNDHFAGRADPDRALIWDGETIPKSSDGAEMTRLVVCPDLLKQSPSIKKRRNSVISHLLVGMIQYALYSQPRILEIDLVAYPGIWRSVFESRLLIPEYIGPEVSYPRKGKPPEIVRAGYIRPTQKASHKICGMYQINPSDIYLQRTTDSALRAVAWNSGLWPSASYWVPPQERKGPLLLSDNHPIHEKSLRLAM
ncbi:MAG: hypothetical protein L6Q57_07730 [Alphaproteobacteria bacterium]|nr:hypothetical protein [Alphaproteobacteria bacterium]